MKHKEGETIRTKIIEKFFIEIFYSETEIRKCQLHITEIKGEEISYIRRYLESVTHWC